MGIACHGGSLSCRAVVVETGTGKEVVCVGRLVVETVCTLDESVECRDIACVGAIGIAAGAVGWRNEPGVGDEFTLIGCPVGTGLDIVDLAHRYAIEVYHVAPNVG